MYHSLYSEFYSPFINLTIPQEDYIRLLQNFDSYMSQPLIMKKDRDIVGEPIGLLGDVEIRFTHYTSFSEALKCWERRCSRLNKENLFIYMAITEVRIAEKFSSLNYENKVGFCDKQLNLESVYNIRNFRESQEALSAFGARGFISYTNDLARRKLYDYDDNLGNRGAKVFKAYDILKLLNGRKDFMRSE